MPLVMKIQITSQDGRSCSLSPETRERAEWCRDFAATVNALLLSWDDDKRDPVAWHYIMDTMSTATFRTFRGR